jgi:hypothetical protein
VHNLGIIGANTTIFWATLEIIKWLGKMRFLDVFVEGWLLAVSSLLRSLQLLEDLAFASVVCVHLVIITPLFAVLLFTVGLLLLLAILSWKFQRNSDGIPIRSQLFKPQARNAFIPVWAIFRRGTDLD